VKKLPAAEREVVASFTADELIERGMAYYDSMRNPLSEADFAAALKAPGLTDEAACVAAYHRADSWFKERDRTRAAPRFDDAIAACEKAGNADLYVKAAYNAGRSYAILRQRETAAARYELIEKHHPEHTYADDARLRQAEEAADLNDQAEVTRLLSTIPEVYPEGDMRAEAMWRLAWRAIKNDNCKEALGWLDKQIATKPIDENYWAEGQPQYWKGRCYAELGKPAESIASYQEAVRLYPLSYYALLALNRLREKHAAEFEALVAEIQRPPADFDPESPPFRFRPREEFATDRFARGVELMRLGLGWAAEAEFRKLGLTAPAGKKEVEDPDQAEKIWAMAYLYHQAGRYEHSHWVTRWHVLDYKRHWPVGHWRLRWDIAFPPGYYELLDRYAKKRGFPTELLQAIVREESAFDPIRESWANAIGLTQMIFPTAKRFARGTGIDPTRENLRDPEKNVTIGTNFLLFLWKKWDGMIALIPPSYNAGEGATMKWVKWRGDWPTDEWAEEIPYDQARRYSKRVIATYFTYSYLEDGTIPEMPNSIPPKLR
jgi:soluble lytic murein transglycosylase